MPRCPRRFPTSSFLTLPIQLVGRHHIPCQMKERISISQTPGPHLQSICGRRREINVHILRPVQHTGGNDYEHVLDFGPFLKEPSSDVSCFQNGFHFPTKPQPDLRKDDKDSGLSLGDQEHDSGNPPRTTPLDACPLGSFVDNHGPQSWRQTRFKLDYPFPGRASPVPPPFPHSGTNNPWSALDPPHPPSLEDLLGRRHPDSSQRKSCEYCRLRKKKCSGHNTCIRCFRIGIDCIYMPDLIAKRVADGLLEFSSPSSGAMKFDAGQLSRRDPGCSYFTSSSLNEDPTENPTQTSGRGTKGRKNKRAANRKPGVTKRQKTLRTGKDPTQSVAPDADQPIPRNNCTNFAGGDLGSVYVVPLHLNDRAIGLAAEDMDFRNTEPRCVNFDVSDRKTHAMSVPERWDISEPQSLFDNSVEALAGHTENDARVPLPTSVTALGWFPRPETTLDANSTKVDPIAAPGFDIFPLLETGLSIDPLSASSLSPLSALPSSPSPVMLSDFGSDRNPMEPWTVDDWLAWYDSTFFL